jgi:hypothetical protein
VPIIPIVWQARSRDLAFKLFNLFIYFLTENISACIRESRSRSLCGCNRIPREVSNTVRFIHQRENGKQTFCVYGGIPAAIYTNLRLAPVYAQTLLDNPESPVSRHPMCRPCFRPHHANSLPVFSVRHWQPSHRCPISRQKT